MQLTTVKKRNKTGNDSMLQNSLKSRHVVWTYMEIFLYNGCTAAIECVNTHRRRRQNNPAPVMMKQRREAVVFSLLDNELRRVPQLATNDYLLLAALLYIDILLFLFYSTVAFYLVVPHIGWGVTTKGKGAIYMLSTSTNLH